VLVFFYIIVAFCLAFLLNKKRDESRRRRELSHSFPPKDIQGYMKKKNRGGMHSDEKGEGGSA